METLEKEVQKLSNELVKRQNENEEYVKQLLDELSTKSKEADTLQKELVGCQKLPSALEELEQLYKNIPESEPSSPVISPSEETIVSNTVNQVISQIQIDASKKDTSVKSSVEKATVVPELCKEKPALPKRKPKLNLDISKVKKDDQLKTKPSEERSGKNNIPGLLHEVSPDKNNCSLLTALNKSECFENNRNESCDFNKSVSPSNASVHNECAIKHCKEVRYIFTIFIYYYTTQNNS